MLNIFFKSAMYYTFFRKYGKKFVLVVSIVGFIFLVNFIYSDVIEYFALNDMRDKLIYALMIKWLLVLVGIGLIAYIIKSSFEKDKVIDTKKKIIKPMSNIEKDIVEKNELISHGDKLIEEMKKRKKDAK